jgi:branched-chain amino acid aminotransferase
VIALLRAAGLAVDEVPLWPVDLTSADEAFLTSSVRGVVPIVRVSATSATGVVSEHTLGDGRPGPITRQVMAAYERLTTGAGDPAAHR